MVASIKTSLPLLCKLTFLHFVVHSIVYKVAISSLSKCDFE